MVGNLRHFSRAQNRKLEPAGDFSRAQTRKLEPAGDFSRAQTWKLEPAGDRSMGLTTLLCDAVRASAVGSEAEYQALPEKEKEKLSGKSALRSLTFKVESKQEEDVQVRVHHLLAFHHLRTMWGLTTEQYRDEWDLPTSSSVRESDGV